MIPTTAPIRVGLCAFGMSGSVFHAPFIAANPHFELARIVERTKQLSAERYLQAAITRSIDELLADPTIELVVVNTPDTTHFDYARQALNAGKHVIVEKPFTTTSAQAQALIDLAQAKQRMLSVFQNRRWDNDYLTIGQLINSGLLGRPVEYTYTFSRYRNFVREDTWKETGEWGGGLTYNLGSHLIDQAVQLFGIPTSVYANIGILREGGQVDDYFLIHLLHGDRLPEVRVTLKASYLHPQAEPRCMVHGTHGSYIKYGIDGQEALLQAGHSPTEAHWGEEPEEEWGILYSCHADHPYHGKYPTVKGDYGQYYRNIYEHLRFQKPLLTDANGVLPVIRIIEAAYQSSKEEQIIHL